MQNEGVDIEVWYLSKFGLQGEVDKQFGTRVKWDIPVLDGYDYSFIESSRKKPSVYGFWGIFNLKLIDRIRKEPPTLFVYNGWNYASYFILWLIAPLWGHKMALRCETPLSHEEQRGSVKKKIRKLILSFYVKRFDYLLAIGNQSAKFHEYLGVPSHKIYFCPYSVNNSFFQTEYNKLKNKRVELRKNLSIPEDAFVYVTTGKYTPKKRPLDIITAFLNSGYLSNEYLVLVGDGELRDDMTKLIKKHNTSNVILTGFVNQSEISQFYSIANVYIMASGVGETWGLSTNEAMNFRLPVVVSSLTGCSADLVRDNGYVFETGDTNSLTAIFNEFRSRDSKVLERMGESSAQIIESYSFASMKKCFDSLQKNANSTHG